MNVSFSLCYQGMDLSSAELPPNRRPRMQNKALEACISIPDAPQPIRLIRIIVSTVGMRACLLIWVTMRVLVAMTRASQCIVMRYKQARLPSPGHHAANGLMQEACLLLGVRSNEARIQRSSGANQSILIRAERERQLAKPMAMQVNSYLNFLASDCTMPKL